MVWACCWMRPRRSGTPGWRFLIWGDGDERPALEQRVKDENIGNVVFKGRVEKKLVPSIVSRADVNLTHNTPSPLFRFGISFNKLFDYLAAGKPVLSDFPCPYNPAVTYGAGLDVQHPDAASVAHRVEEMAAMGPEERTSSPAMPCVRPMIMTLRN